MFSVMTFLVYCEWMMFCKEITKDNFYELQEKRKTQKKVIDFFQSYFCSFSTLGF